MSRTRNLRAESNPVPFRDRLACSVNTASYQSDLSRRKIIDLMNEGVLESTKVDGRRLVIVPSLLKLLDSGAGAPFVEPPQLKRAREAAAVERGA
jgi:hypothetical protein